MVLHFRRRMKELYHASEAILAKDKKKLHGKRLIAMKPNDQVDDALPHFASGLPLTLWPDLLAERIHLFKLVEHEE